MKAKPKNYSNSSNSGNSMDESESWDERTSRNANKPGTTAIVGRPATVRTSGTKGTAGFPKHKYRNIEACNSTDASNKQQKT